MSRDNHEANSHAAAQAREHAAARGDLVGARLPSSRLSIGPYGARDLVLPSSRLLIRCEAMDAARP